MYLEKENIGTTGMKKNEWNDSGSFFPEETYAALINWDDQEIAFVKGEEVAGMEIWRVYAADGTQLAIADSRDAAFMLARQNDLEPKSVH